MTKPHAGTNLDDIPDEIPLDYRERFLEIVALTDAFCETHLDQEFAEVCRHLTGYLCQDGSPVLRGKPESWACGVTYAIGHVNFLTDPNTTPHMKANDIAKGYGVSPATMHAKFRVLRENLDLGRFDPEFTVDSRMSLNPYMRIASVNGMPIDV